MYNHHICGSVGLIFKDNYKQVLLVKRRDVPVWYLPSGGINEGETFEDCVIREVFEETGYITKVSKLVGIYNNTWSGGILYTYVCEIVGGEQKLSAESKEVAFHNIADLPKLRTLFVDQRVEDALKNTDEIIRADLKKIPLNFYLRKAIKHPVVAFRYFLVYKGIHINT